MIELIAPFWPVAALAVTFRVFEVIRRNRQRSRLLWWLNLIRVYIADDKLPEPYGHQD